MANFTLETNRNTAIQNIPRLVFQLPQSTSGTNPSTTNPIYFCQIGCQLDFQFNNITSAKLQNDGNFFTITPTDNSNNYINWNGSGASGQNMIRFDLKEIKFSAPAKDVINSITYNRSIQIYFTFVNTTYPNIMIVITIIGQANNVGNALTDGFVLMNSLTPQIPLKREIKNISDLKNVNLGKLLPTNKSFFSTLIDTNSIQYISMTRIIDIPQSFLDTLISRVLNGPDDYQSKVNKYTQQNISNPQGTIIFYTENIKPINSDEAIVCNANCDQVVGNASLLTPEFGKSTTAAGTRAISSKTITKKPANVPAEECEEEYLFPGSTTKVNVKCGGSSTSADTSNEINLTNEEISKSTTQGILIGLFIVLIIAGTILIFFFLTRAANVNWREIFSPQLWTNSENIPWIIVTFIGFLAIFSCVTAALFKISEETSDKDTSKHKIKAKSWVLFLIGFSIWLVCIIILFLQSKYSFGKDRFGKDSFGKDSFGKDSFGNSTEIQRFDSLRSKIISDYSSNPSDFTAQGSSGRKNLLEASKIYNNLSANQKAIINKNNPQLASLLGPNSKLIQELGSQSKIENQKGLSTLIQSLEKKPVLITPKVESAFKGLRAANPDNNRLAAMKNNITVGSPVPVGLRAYIDSKK
jgi:hypothetical protein